MVELIPIILNIVALSSILMLVGLGLAITYGLMDLINVSHGEFITLGAYSMVIVQGLGVGFWPGLIVAPILGAAAGVLLEKGLVRFLYTRPLEIILATWGVSMIMRQGIQMIFGGKLYGVIAPVSGAVTIFGAQYPAYRLIVIAIAGILMLTSWLVIRHTSFGLDVRTVIQDRDMAEAMGINTKRVFALAFAMGSALASMAGALIAPMGAVTPMIGFAYLTKAFFVVIVGGVGNIAGVMAGSGLIGGLETVLNYQITPSWSQALVLIIAITIVRFRPQGLLGS